MVEGQAPAPRDAYGHSIVRYSALWSSMRPASSISTLMPGGRELESGHAPGGAAAHDDDVPVARPRLDGGGQAARLGRDGRDVEVERLVDGHG
jgi:hypothetical protein